MEEIVINAVIGEDIYTRDYRIEKKLSGIIESLIIQTESTAVVNIYSTLGYWIYSGRVHETSYIPLRTYAVNPVGGTQSSRGACEKFKLNEKVIIQIEGVPKQEIKLIIRFE